MVVKYYRPKRKADLRSHLLRDHAADVIALAESMTVRDLTRLHDRIHKEKEIEA